MQNEVREVIANIIKKEGVDHVFGHTGGHIRQLWDALEQNGLKTVFNKIEGNGVFMAMGHYQQSGIIGVVLGTSGPGVQNMVTATASAHLDSIPLIIIGAGVPTFSAGKNPIQDSSGRGRAVDQRLIFKACAKDALTIETPEQTPSVLREAFRTALSGRPGPVYVQVPSNYWRTKINYKPQDPKAYKNNQPLEANQKETNIIMQALYKSKNPVIAIGSGAITKSSNKNILNKFINQISVPIIVSPLAKDLIDECGKLYLGTLRGTQGPRIIYKHLKDVDFILSLGNRFEQWSWDWVVKKENVIPKAKIAQVDPDPYEIGRVFPADYSQVTDIYSFIQKAKIKRHPQTNLLQKLLAKYKKQLDLSSKKYKDTGGIHPLNLVNISQQIMPQNTCVVSDTGNIGSLIITRFKTSSTQRFLHSQRNSPMGYGVPASIGATFHHKGDVICFVGDGSFNMTGNELGLLMNYKMKVIFIISNDSSCSMIKDGNMEEFSYTNMTEFTNPDYCKIAEAYGFIAFRAKNSQEYKEALQKALKGKKSVLIDTVIGNTKGVWDEV